MIQGVAADIIQKKGFNNGAPVRNDGSLPMEMTVISMFFSCIDSNRLAGGQKKNLHKEAVFSGTTIDLLVNGLVLSAIQRFQVDQYISWWVFMGFSELGNFDRATGAIILLYMKRELVQHTRSLSEMEINIVTSS